MITQTNQPRKVRKNILKTVFLLSMAVAAVTVSAQTTALSKQITLGSRTQTRIRTISDIEAQTSYHVLFNTNNLNGESTVNFGRTTLTLKSALDKLTEGTPLTYTIDDKHIVIFQNAASASKTESVISVISERNLVGTVVNTADDGLGGVTVEIVGVKGKSTTTHTNGRFRIGSVTPGNHVVKLTSADGNNIRYREVNVPASKDADAVFTFNDVILATAQDTTQVSGADIIAPTNKPTAYYVQSIMADKTVRAFADEPKTQLFFASVDDVNKNYLPKTAVKTNLLYLGATTLNAGMEFGLARRWTFDFTAAYNPFMLQKGGVNKIWFVQPEARYWFCQRFEKHFIGLHGIYGQFNVGEVTFLTKTFEDHRYDGWGAGGGISYGYHLPIGKRWAWEFTVGAGVIYYEYDQFRCYECDNFEGRKSGIYFGPTKAGISLIFMIK